MGKKSRLKKERKAKVSKAKSFNILRKAHQPDKHDFYPRLLFSIGKIRKNVFDEGKLRNKFDNYQSAVVQNVLEAEYAKRKIAELMLDHSKKIKKGRATIINGNTIQIDIIDFELNVFFKDFVIRSIMALDNLQDLCRFLDFEFLLWAKEEKFLSQLEMLEKRYKKATRGGDVGLLFTIIKSHKEVWIETFKKLRNKIEHEGFQLPEVQYKISRNGQITPCFPCLAATEKLEASLEALWGNLFTFCEEMMALVLALKIKSPFCVVHLPEENRDSTFPIRFKISLSPKDLQQIARLNSEN